MNCRACNAVIADNALICYKCGTATSEPRIPPPAARRRGSRWPLVGGVIVLGAALAALAQQMACGSLL
jgi:hypothetical protein